MIWLSLFVFKLYFENVYYFFCFCVRFIFFTKPSFYKFCCQSSSKVQTFFRCFLFLTLVSDFHIFAQIKSKSFLEMKHTLMILLLDSFEWLLNLNWIPFTISECLMHAMEKERIKTAKTESWTRLSGLAGFEKSLEIKASKVINDLMKKKLYSKSNKLLKLLKI